ncbi:MAG TPA: DNA gyrase inhibitor YacG [Stellaceae bacterium]|nr:DNA gyrase inhibitor YacG [Stellaceae bacterium]
MSPNDNPGLPPAAACPICGKPAAARDHRPFCSARCRNIDLGRWLKGSYRVETEDGPEGSLDEEG